MADPDFIDQPDDAFEDDEDEAVCCHCWGEGYVHDCGEDTCCCAEPEIADLYRCEWCEGTGYVR
jgi:hypothetical protein